MQADIIRAYHFGSNYLVEVEVILPEKMSVREAHDISLDLQKKIEEEVKKAKANAVSNKTGSFGWIYPCYLSRTLVPPTPLVRPIMITITDLSLSSVWFLPLIGIWVYMGVTFTRNSGYASSQTEESIRIGFR